MNAFALQLDGSFRLERDERRDSGGPHLLAPRLWGGVAVSVRKSASGHRPRHARRGTFADAPGFKRAFHAPN